MNKQQIVLVALGLLGLAVFTAFALTQFAKQDSVIRGDRTGQLPSIENADETVDSEGEDTGVLVYFSRDESGLREVFPFMRESEDENDFLFAMEELVRGPNQEEAELGYISELQFSADEESACDDRNFSIVAESGTFVVWLCRTIANQDDEDAPIRAFNQVDATMRQFEMVDNLVVLDRERDCFADSSEENACYEVLPSGISP